MRSPGTALWRAPLGALLSLLALAGCGQAEEESDLSSFTLAVHTVCGGPNTVLGIDVSKWQGSVNWSAVKGAGKQFAFARVSDGTTYKDQYFSANWKGMKSAGIIRGAYQYFRPNQDPIQQADYFVSAINSAGGMQTGDLPGVLDLETTSGMSSSAILKNVDAWIARVQQGTNRRPIIYTGSYFWDSNIYSTKYTSHALWTAHYTTKPCPLVPNPWKAWKFWQYTDKASVAGVSGNADANRFNGTLAELTAFAAASVVKPTDAGVPDSRPPDKGQPDKGKPDKGQPAKLDKGRPDKGRPDAGPPPKRDTGLIPGGDGEPAATYNMSYLQGGCSVGHHPGPSGWPLLLIIGVILYAIRSGYRSPSISAAHHLGHPGGGPGERTCLYGEARKRPKKAIMLLLSWGQYPWAAAPSQYCTSTVAEQPP